MAMNANLPSNNVNNAATTAAVAASTTSKSSSSRSKWCTNIFNKRGRTRMIILSRSCFLLSMAIAAAVCGYVAYRVTSHLQNRVALKTYESIASAAIREAAAISNRKQQGGKVLSSILSNAFPSASMWPSQVGLPGYTSIATNVAEQSSTSGHAFMVIVRPEEVEEFESHAQKIYKDLNYPETAGYSEFGFGIHGMKPDPNATQEEGQPRKMIRFHDTMGRTKWGSNHSILVPFFQHSVTYKNPNILMKNVHQIESRGIVMDRIIQCADQFANENPNAMESPPNCASVTVLIDILMNPRPTAVFLYPIYPNFNKSTVVGFVGTSVHWEEILTDIVPDYVDGLEGVISQAGENTECYTYTIQRGQPSLKDRGDLHDKAYTQYGYTVELNPDTATGQFEHSYELTLYPTATIFEEFHSSTPIFVSIGFITVIVVCTIIFFLYDFFMRTASNERKRILQMKRRFIRFVSHEIRTPLNVVKMGLELLQGEIRDSLEEQNALVRRPSSGTFNETYVSYGDIDSHSSGRKSPSDGGNNSKLPEWIDLTGDLMENTQNAVSVLDDLLNYDKIESGTFKMEHTTDIDIDKLVQKVVSDFSIQARNKNISLDLVTAEGRSLISHNKLHAVGDLIRLTQAVRNLISNAIKFTPETVGIITVTERYNPVGLPEVTGTSDVVKKESRKKKSSDAAKEVLTRQRAGSIIINVKDNGAGLSKEQLSLLFREGMQFDANKLQAGGGSGLGLCITKEIIQRHGGTIVAHSEGLGFGTTFTMEIPLFKSGSRISTKSVNDETSSVTQMSIQSESQSEAKTNENKCLHKVQESHHILVVDDVISNTKLLVRLLERAGHTCQVAMNGQEAVDAFIQNQADCSETALTSEDSPMRLIDTVLMDNLMPVLDGPSATKQLRELGCKAHIIGITGNVMAEDVEFFKSCGADAVLPKPVNLKDIKEIWDLALMC